MTGSSLQTEGTNTHAYPFVQASESPGNLCDAKIVGISSNDRIEIMEDSLDIPPLLSPGHIPDTVFELFKGTRSDAKAEASKVKPQELESLVKIREASFHLME
jgi:hypothetical protein